MMRINRHLERTMSAWLWRMLLGPVQAVDGVVYSVTAGFVCTGFALAVVKKLSRARLAAQPKDSP